MRLWIAWQPYFIFLHKTAPRCHVIAGVAGTAVTLLQPLQHSVRRMRTTSTSAFSSIWSPWTKTKTMSPMLPSRTSLQTFKEANPNKNIHTPSYHEHFRTLR
ncbi:hypothetical protein DES53_101255 [Roseimicrobium gellanilyticum]|uniref:Uncharacterized protein n=1 Tax=Roseimicrobium gellanilyticum TaxID=748857 RepID=A0A366HVZ0_9BACT|nr:hypothetical protein DES53_101255 [Roseimicrobium gellanilyticum]